MWPARASSRIALSFPANVYSNRDFDQLSKIVTSGISNVIPCDIASYNEYDVGTTRMRATSPSHTPWIYPGCANIRTANLLGD
jgi:hypothetical protein